MLRSARAPLTIAAQAPLGFLLLAITLRTSIQLQPSLGISDPDTQAFPTISLMVSVSDESGRRISGLTTDNFQILEDDLPVGDFAVEEVLVGTRQVFVINTAPGLGVRDSHGRTRFDYVREELLDYWRDPDASLIGIDDLSLLTSEGLLIQHSGAAAELAAALDEMEPLFEGGISGFDLLLIALDFSADPLEGEQLPSSLVFMTPLIETPRDLPIANAIARASESDTSIFPVLFSSEEALEQPEVEPLQELADSTGGQFLAFDPERGLGEVAGRILDQRYQYKVTFYSQADTPGTHMVRIQVSDEGFQTISPPVSYDIDVRPPEVAFIQPPNEIARQTDNPDLELDKIAPTSFGLQILTTFPDGHARSLVRSSLLVDDEVIDVRRVAPFDRFEWDLTKHRQSGIHTLRVLVEDSLGLEAETIEHPVQVIVSRPELGLSAFRPALDSLVAVLAVIVAGMVLVIGLTTLIRRAPIPEPAAGVRLNPVRRTRLQSNAPPEALLIPLRPSGDTVPLTGVDVVLGRDASLAAIVLDDPSVERMHARLIRQADGEYMLRDQGSVAGSWINYELVPKSGKRLQHGDHIQLGRVEFRFQLPGDHAPRKIRVSPDEGPLTE
ncbi:MAG: FHA domain-containing protein [Anaerolineales bacterium]